MADRKSPSISTVSASPIRGIALLAALLAGSTALCLLANYLDHLPARPEPLSPQEIARYRLSISLSHDPTEIAARAAEDYLADYPGDERARRELIALYRKNKKPEKAIDHLGKLADANPRDVDVFLLYGDVAGEAGEIRTALKAFRQARKLAPKDPRPYKGLALAYRAQGDTLLALNYMETAVSLNMNDMAARNVLMELRRGIVEAGPLQGEAKPYPAGGMDQLARAPMDGPSASAQGKLPASGLAEADRRKLVGPPSGPVRHGAGQADGPPLQFVPNPPDPHSLVTGPQLPVPGRLGTQLPGASRRSP